MFKTIGNGFNKVVKAATTFEKITKTASMILKYLKLAYKDYCGIWSIEIEQIEVESEEIKAS
ncbi:hypothetical protein [Tenacibaculum holothuriorum]|nr:hypothetical protein [Tenacibaculum holothuriorum]